MAIVFVQFASNQTASTSTVVTPSATTTSGNLLVAIVYEDASNSSTLGITDSASQTWLQVGSTITIGNAALAMFYKANSTAVTTITGTSTTSATLPVCVYEISGIATSLPLDGFATASNVATGLSLTSGALTTTNANDILIFGAGKSSAETGSWTAGSGFTTQTPVTNARANIERKTVAATQAATTTTLTWGSTGVDRLGIFAAFADTPVNAGPTIGMMMAPSDVPTSGLWIPPYSVGSY